MAMFSIIGLQGAGKSHQAVKGIIIPNFAKGRRILTNIKGFNIEELKKYCIEELKSKPEDLGEIVIISDRDIRTQCKLSLKELQEININDPRNKDKLKSFYPFLLEVDNKEIIIDTFSTVKAGDVIVIDEAGSFYKKVSDYDMEFFRMHRHFTNDHGIACELCFMFQTKAMVHRDFFNLMFQVYQCKKLSSVGLTKAYSLQIFDGSSLSQDTKINSEKAFYDNKVFPIYSSYAKGKGKEQKLDLRGSIFSNKIVWISLVFIIASFSFAIYFVSGFFSPKKKLEEKPKTEIAQTKTETVQQQKPQSAEAPILPPNYYFRIVGVVDYDKSRFVVIQDENGGVRYINPQFCIGKGLQMQCNFDNRVISFYNVPFNNSLLGGNNEKNNSNNNRNTIN